MQLAVVTNLNDWDICGAPINCKFFARASEDRQRRKFTDHDGIVVKAGRVQGSNYRRY